MTDEMALLEGLVRPQDMAGIRRESPQELLKTPVQTAINNPVLEFRDGQFLYKWTDELGGAHEGFRSAASVREAFSGIPIDSGWLAPEIVRWGTGRRGEWVVAFMPPQAYELELTTEINGQTASVDRIKAPLPGLVLFGIGVKYYIFAVKTERLDPYQEIKRCPLPNVDQDGLICWGLLKPPRASAKTIFEAFRLFMGSTFNNHYASGKSKERHDDVRLVLRGLAERLALQYPGTEEVVRYPVKDLVRMVAETGIILDQAIRGYFEH
jgi:hypothetical protein